jgi:ribosome-associated toxin RatA of RatAB toxin-antitoxin module
MRTITERGRGRIALALGLLLAAHEPLGQEPDTAWIDEDALRNREILFTFGEDQRFRGRVYAAAAVEATPEQIWAILRDCESAPEYLENVESCEMIETLNGGRSEIFRQRAKLRWFLPSFEHEFRLDYEPYHRITVSRVSGPLDRLDAVWWLIPATPTRTLVVYRLDLEAGLLVPKFLLAAPLRRDVLNALRSVRERAERVQAPAR